MLRATILAIFLLATASAQAQPIRTLTLEDAVTLARGTSPEARQARLSFEAASQRFRAYEAAFRPSLTLSGSLPGLDRSIREVTEIGPDDTATQRFVEQSQLLTRATLSVSQQIAPSGTRIFASTSLSRIDDGPLFGSNVVTQYAATPFILGIAQPLFRFNELRWQRRVEPLRYRIAEQSLQENLEQSAADVADRFFDVVSQQISLEIARFNVAVNDTVYTLAQGRYQIGAIAENELLQTELQQLNAQAAFSEATISLAEAEQALKLALGLPYDTEIAVVPPLDLPEVRADPDAAVAEARRRRSAYVSLDADVLEAERSLAQTKSENGFAADISAQAGFNQRGPALDDAYTDLLDQQRFGITFTMPLYRWGQGKAEEAAARADLARAEEERDQRRLELDQEVFFEVLRLEQLRRQVDIASKADTVAARRFEVARNRYRIGKIDITDLFDAQREKDTARRSFVQTLRQFWTSYYRLRSLTLYDVVEGAPIR